MTIKDFENILLGIGGIIIIRVINKLGNKREYDYYSPDGIDRFCRTKTTDDDLYAKTIKAVFKGNCTDYYKSIIVGYIPHDISQDELVAVQEIMQSSSASFYKANSIKNMFS